MSKNIVLCSDGTGNAGGKMRGTNVWRLYQAVDRSPRGNPEQIAIHDDGVGSQDHKMLRILGGAIGWGITRNLEQLYGYLMRHFDPGKANGEEQDSIYLFGFSRGAFTVRVLANILYYCGIAESKTSNGERSPEEIARIASRAVRAYKKRRPRHPDAPGAPLDFRIRFGVDRAGTPDDARRFGRKDSTLADLRSQFPDVYGNRGRFQIRFIGVWDTVDAVGLPVDELTQLFYHGRLGKILFGLNLDRRCQRHDSHGTEPWENDFHDFIEHGRHALSIDDERRTFHPVLWLEDGFQQGERTLEDDRESTIQQVWFAGPHSNVGGGYAKDTLSLVSLDWMMQEAQKYGLRFKNDDREKVARDADVNGQMYDSRSGAAVYYRYAPRDLADICKKAGLRCEQEPQQVSHPKIHEAVLQRIQHETDDYAPTLVPADYQVVTPGQPYPNPVQETVEGRRNREAAQKRVRRGIWIRWILYCALLWWTAIVLVVCASPGLLNGVRLAGKDIRTSLMPWIVGLGAALFAGGLKWWFERRGGVTNLERIRSAWALGLVRNVGVLVLILLLLHNPITQTLRWLAPGVTKSLAETLVENQAAFLVICITTYVLLAAMSAARRRISTAAKRAWDISLRGQETEDAIDARAREAKPGMRLWRRLVKLWWRFVATVILAVVGGAAGWLLLTSLCIRFRGAGEEVVSACDPGELESERYLKSICFHTTERESDTGLDLTVEKVYRIAVSPFPPAEVGAASRSAPRVGSSSAFPPADPETLWQWKDKSLPATPNGLLGAPLKMQALAPWRRVASQPWFRLLGSIDKGAKAIIPVGTGIRFKAPASGRLYLFVNDATGYYHNNVGVAWVTIYECVRSND